MAMPKAAVNEANRAVATQDQVGRSGQTANVESEAEPVCVQCASSPRSPGPAAPPAPESPSRPGWRRTALRGLTDQVAQLPPQLYVQLQCQIALADGIIRSASLHFEAAVSFQQARRTLTWHAHGPIPTRTAPSQSDHVIRRGSVCRPDGRKSDPRHDDVSAPDASGRSFRCAFGALSVAVR